ncbi:MAG TPA: hypothetical protein VK661_06525 [Planctomycetota bacterium]|nr:hypothetical protein [Planctomycetota bacterium]
MRLRHSAVLALAGVFLAGCAGEASPDAGSPFNDPGPSTTNPATAGKAIKVSYVWFFEEQDVRTRQTRVVHNYRYMLSEGWTNRKGPTPQEPFERLWRDPYMATVQDSVMEELVRKMMASGFGELRESEMGKIDLQALQRIEKTNDRQAARMARVITIETENFKKTATLRDNDDSKGNLAGPLMQKYRAVEKTVLAQMSSFTIQVTVEKSATMPR